MKDLDEMTFKASSQWLWRFRNRHGEKLSVDPAAPEPFRKTLEEYIENEGLTLDQVYNCDETGLYFRLLPRKTLAAATEKSAPGMTSSKDRVTLMACLNATGTHKLPFLLIGKTLTMQCTLLNLAYLFLQGSLPNLDASRMSIWLHYQ